LEDHGDEPAVSLDLGRDQRVSDDLIRTGDILGNILSKYGEAGGHHTTASFKSEFARPEIFAHLIESFQSHLESLQ
jgi:hypothetical protein